MRRIISRIITNLKLDTFKEILMIRLRARKKIHSQWAQTIGNLYKNIVKPGMLVFDIGANKGHYTYGFLKMGANVVCVEPQKDCYKILQARYKNNPRVKLLNCALDYEEGEKKIYISNMNTVSSMSEDWISAVKKSKRFPDAMWKRADSVKTYTLESLIEKYGKPGFIKIDVEGYELNVLKGLKSKVPLISIEYTSEIIETTIQCLEYLSGIDKVLVLIDDTSVVMDESKWMTDADAIKTLKEMKNDTAGDLYIKFAL